MTDDKIKKPTVSSSKTDVKAFAKAFLKVKAQTTNPIKDTEGYGYKYSKLEQILEILDPALEANDLLLTQTPKGEIINGCMQLETEITHAATGYSKIYNFYIPMKGGQNPTQDFGSALSYGRRYHLLSIFSLAQEDDDGKGSKDKSELSNHDKLVDEADKRLGDLEITDWAEANKFIPHRAKTAALVKFMNLSDEELLATVKKWEGSK